MDQRLKEIADNLDKMLIGLDEPFRFHCTQCGKCCIHREDILLNPRDVFRAARELAITPQEFVKIYCDTYLGESSRMPIVRILPRGSVRRCPLMKDRKCSIHKAKPTVCAMFPIGRIVRMEANKVSGKEITAEQVEYIYTKPECGDNSEPHTVREWLGEFGIPLEDDFFVRWQNVCFFLGPVIQKCIDELSEETANDVISILYHRLYLNYDINGEFMPQYIKNEKIIRRLVEISPIITQNRNKNWKGEAL